MTRERGASRAEEKRPLIPRRNRVRAIFQRAEWPGFSPRAIPRGTSGEKKVDSVDERAGERFVLSSSPPRTSQFIFSPIKLIAGWKAGKGSRTG